LASIYASIYGTYNGRPDREICTERHDLPLAALGDCLERSNILVKRAKERKSLFF
jgi:hypothetical protein